MDQHTSHLVDVGLLGAAVAWVVAWVRKIRGVAIWQIFLVVMCASLALVILMRYLPEIGAVAMDTIGTAMAANGAHAVMRKKVG